MGRVLGSHDRWEHLGRGTFFLSVPRPGYALPVRAVFQNGTWPRSETSSSRLVSRMLLLDVILTSIGLFPIRWSIPWQLQVHSLPASFEYCH